MSERWYKGIFLAGALWNLLGGAFIIAATGWIFATAGLAPPRPALYYYAWIALFMTFGIGYAMVCADMYGNKNIVVLGIIGKLAFAAIFIAFLLQGQAPSLFLIPVAGDLVFVVLYWMFLSFARRAGR